MLSLACVLGERNECSVDSGCRRRGLTLVVRNLMARLVDPREGEVAILPRLTVLLSVPDERFITRGVELFLVGVDELFADGFAAEPVADVV
jgi:hypothetical protein